MMRIHDHCLYAAFGQTVQDQGWFVVRRNLTSCLQAFRDAQAAEASFIVLFADASYDSSTLESWSIVQSVEFNGAGTRIVFDSVRSLPLPRRVSELRKVVDGKPISESIRRGQIVSRTPTFIHALASSAGRRRKPHMFPAKTEPQVPTGAGFRDPEQNREVEQAAVQIVADWYKKEGWQVTSVEAQRCGFDLLCRRGRAEAHVEVKGATGNERRFIITAGEMRHATSDDRFILALVTNTLSQNCVLQRWTASQFRQQFVFEPIQYWAESKVTIVTSPNKPIEADAKRRHSSSAKR